VDCCCTDIANVVGVIGTPVIDTASGTMYLVAKNKNTDGTYHQWLHALDTSTGAEKFSGPKEIISAGKFDPKLNNQRPGLLLQAGNVYIGWASHNDCGAYHGLFSHTTRAPWLRLRPGVIRPPAQKAASGCPAADWSGTARTFTSARVTGITMRPRADKITARALLDWIIP